MKIDSGLHEHSNNQINQQSTFWGESELSVFKPLNPSTGTVSSKKSPEVSKRSLINTINHLHFTKAYLWAHIKGQILQDNLLVKLYPGPCMDDEVVLSLPASAIGNIDLQGYHLHKLIIEEGKMAIIIPVILRSSTPTSITVALPNHGFLVSARKSIRLSTPSISCEVIQGESRIQGILREFSVSGLRVMLNNDTELSSFIPSINQPVSVRIFKDDALVYEGVCRIMREGNEGDGHFIVLNPLQKNTESMRINHQKRIRNERLNLIPTPKVVFEHPLSRILVSYEIFDITTSGFSLNEHVDECMLLPGMYIPEVKLLFSGDNQLLCSAQILHAHKKGDWVRIGFVIKDMDWTSCIKLCDIIANAIDPHANMNTVHNMDALWDIFFDTGFIYPQKYQYLSNFRDDFKENYRRLYQNGRKDVAFHFTYQKNNRIYGHISFIRAYERLWMIHHFAARTMHGKKRVGLEVYKHIFSMYDAITRLPSSKINHIMFYFRPSSSFNMYFQAGFCRSLNNPRACSMDLFAYYTLTPANELNHVPTDWSLTTFVAQDYEPLRESYNHLSGGALLDAIDISQLQGDIGTLEHDYASMGLFRKTNTYALKLAGDLKAVFIVDQSDVGLNLSDLLNSIKVLITDQSLPWDVLHACLCKLAAVYQSEQVPVMLFPSDYLESKGVACSRYYYLWILDSKFCDLYIQWMKKKININPLKILFREIQSKLNRIWS